MMKKAICVLALAFLVFGGGGTWHQPTALEDGGTGTWHDLTALEDGGAGNWEGVVRS